MILLFFLSILYLNKPSDSLTRDDIDNIRHKRKPDQNGNDHRYKGKRSESRFYMGGWGGGWFTLLKQVLILYEDYSGNSSKESEYSERIR